MEAPTMCIGVFSSIGPFYVAVRTNATVVDLKRAIEKKRNILPDWYRLERAHGMGPLGGNGELSLYGLNDGSMVQLFNRSQRVDEWNFTPKVVFNGAVVHLPLMCDLLVFDLKKMIRTYVSVAPCHQELTCKGIKLTDELRLSNVVDDCPLAEITLTIKEISIRVMLPLMGRISINVPAYANIEELKKCIYESIPGDPVHIDLYLEGIQMTSNQTTYSEKIGEGTEITAKISTNEGKLLKVLNWRGKELKTSKRRFAELDTDYKECRDERDSLRQKVAHFEEFQPQKLYNLKSRDLSSEKLDMTLNQCKKKLDEVRYDRSRLETMIDNIHREKERRNKKECLVCRCLPPNIAFVPCGHVVTCESCSGKIINDTGKCVCCRLDIESVVKIFGV